HVQPRRPQARALPQCGRPLRRRGAAGRTGARGLTVAAFETSAHRPGSEPVSAQHISSAGIEHRDVVIVGAGQAGLSISWHLTERGIDHLVLERDTIAHEWLDSRWDNFTLVTPNWQCAL